MRTVPRLSVSFYTRANKSTKDESPVMLRVSLNGLRSSFGQIGLSVKPAYLKKSRVLPSHPDKS